MERRISLSKDNEYNVLDIITNSKNLSQRELAKEAGISLGLTNIILKRLVKTGYLKVRSLNRKKVEYILTPKGMKEKTRRSYEYIKKTMRTYLELRDRLNRMIMNFYENGKRTFYILGDGEIADILELTIREMDYPKLRFEHIREYEAGINDGEAMVLDCKEYNDNQFPGVSVLSRLLEGI